MSRDDSNDAGWTGGDGGINGGGSSGNSNNANSGDGWTTTTDPGGWTVHHYTGSDSDDTPEGNDSGLDGSTGALAMATMVLGVPDRLPVKEVWSVKIKPIVTLPSFFKNTISRIAVPSLTRAAFGRYALFGSLMMYSKSLNSNEEDMLSERGVYAITGLPVHEVTDVAIKDLVSLSEVVTNFNFVSAVLSEKEDEVYGVPTEVFTSAAQIMGLISPIGEAYKSTVSVVQATEVPNQKGVYSVSVAPGLPNITLDMRDTRPVSTQTMEALKNEKQNVKDFVTPISEWDKVETHEKIVTFPDNSGHSPIYLSVTPILTKPDIAEQIEKAKREKEAWEKAHPVEAAEMKVNVSQMKYDAVKSSAFAALYLDPVSHPMVYSRPDRRIVMGAYDYPLAPKSISITKPGHIEYFIEKSWETTLPLPVATTDLEKVQQKYLVEDYTYLSMQLNLAKSTLVQVSRELTLAKEHLAKEKAKLQAEKDRIEREKRLEAERKAIESIKALRENALINDDVMALDGQDFFRSQLSVRGKGINSLSNSVISLLYSMSEMVNNPAHANKDVSVELLSFGLSSPESLGLVVPIPENLIGDYFTVDNKLVSEFSIRGEFVSFEGETRLNMYRTGSNGIPSYVDVLFAELDIETEFYKVILPEPFGTILITPSGAPRGGIPSLENPVIKINLPVHTGTSVEVLNIPLPSGMPIPEYVDFNDFIISFPSRSGLKPIYVMLNSPRDKPGVATGKGEIVGDRWLDRAGEELGAAIPTQIADRIRGREFKNFDEFRKVVWLEVGKEVGLANQFRENNRKNLKKGYSPFTPKSERVGGRVRYELHHVQYIKDGGKVYDVDNIRVMTPKRHIEIHKEG